jgi:hypothetical protein
MKKILIVALALALTGGVAYANYCARDVVPAATLLVPYVVVDTTATGTPDPSGYTTLLTVTNVSSARQLIHVTVWNALSQHVVDFDEMLSGYDVWNINFRDLLTADFENFDTTSDFPSPAADTPYAWGPTSNASSTGYPITAPATTGTAPNSTCGYPYGTRVKPYIPFIMDGLTVPLKAYVTQDATGCNFSTFASPAWLTGISPTRVFFYVTVDAANVCSTEFPDDAGGAYFTNLVPSNNNVLTGDIYYLNMISNYAEAVPAVHIEATNLSTTGLNTFYSRYTKTPRTGLDSREPLATAFAFHYYNSGGITSELRVWKSYTQATLGSADSYGFYKPTGTITACTPYVYYAFDENENSQSRTYSGLPSPFFGAAEPNTLPLETQSVPLTVANFDGLMPNNGWMLLVFDPSILGPTYNTMAWAGVKVNYGTYSTMVEATTMANAFCFASQQLPTLGINYPYQLGVSQ